MLDISLVWLTFFETNVHFNSTAREATTMEKKSSYTNMLCDATIIGMSIGLAVDILLGNECHSKNLSEKLTPSLHYMREIGAKAFDVHSIVVYPVQYVEGTGKTMRI